MTAAGLLIIIGGLFIGYEALKNLRSGNFFSSATVSGSGGSAPSTTSVNVDKSLVPSEVQSTLTQALQLTGKPLDWLDGLLFILSKENAGYSPTIQNPCSVLSTKDNCRKDGEHATGLFQVIPSTFHGAITSDPSGKYTQYNDINNPLHNAIAAIIYIGQRYGSPYDSKLVASENAGVGY